MMNRKQVFPDRSASYPKYKFHFLHRKIKVLKWFFKRFFETALKVLSITLEGNGSLKNPCLKGSLRDHKWCLKEPFEGTLRHLYRFFEELFKEMVL